MSFQIKALPELTEADIRGLIDAGIPEGKHIDYKRDLPDASNPGDKKEFLFDVSSLANAGGGHLIYGMHEEGGIPTEVSPVSVPDVDAEWLRWHSMILDGIDPRISGVEGRFVPIGNSRHVLVIHVPKSWNPPHMVIFQGVNRFYTRDSARKHQLDVAELRSLFALSSSLTEQIRRFRIERLARIIASETPVTLPANPKIVMHLLPLQAFSSSLRVDLSKAQQLSQLVPVGAPGYNRRINLDGLLNYSRGYLERSDSDAYLQLYHSGIIESVDASILGANAARDPGGLRLIPSAALDREIIKCVPEYCAALRALGITSSPIVVALTLIGVKGYNMAVNGRYWGGGGAAIDRDVVNVPEVLLDGLVCHPRNVKPMIDAVWNAAGWLGSVNVDANGNLAPN